MIRILHTADWHIGQTMRGYTREYEHAAVLKRLGEILVEREVDALVVAGDIFDSQNPSGESQRLFYDSIVRFSRLCPAMTTVIVAGNHDAAGRLEAPRPLMKAFNVHVVGSVRRLNGAIEAERHVVPLRDSNGEVAANVVAVSYPTAACLPSLVRLEDESGSPVVRAVRELYAELWGSLESGLSGLPVLMTGHLHVAGGVESEGAERRILVGGQHAVPADVFPDGADYVALGHLHKSQHVGRETVRYSGSLIPLSATELPYKHGVTLLTLGGSSPAAIEHIPIDRPVPFVRVPASGEIAITELADALEALALPKSLPIHERPFVQVRLDRTLLAAGFREEVDAIAERFPVRVVDVRVTALDEAAEDAATSDPHQRLADRDPEDLFKLAFERHHRSAPAPAHLDVFHKIYAEVH